MKSEYAHLGHVYYNAHPASPLVLGDLQIMKGWKGNSDGNNDNEVIDIGTGKVFTCDLDLHAPDVFVRGDEVVLLNEGSNHSLMKDYTVEDLQGVLTAEATDAQTFEIDVPSGALVLTIAYNATPEEGADTSGLSDLCWHEDLPFLPKAPPAKPYYPDDEHPDWQGHCIVPVKPGAYAIEYGYVKGDEGSFVRVAVRPKR